MCRFSVTYRVDFGYFLHANDFCDHRLQIVRIVGIEKRVLLMDTTTSSQIWPLKWWWWPLGMTSAAHDKYYTGPYAPQCIYIDCIYNPQAGGEGVERGLTRGDGKHGTCGPPERRPVERKRSRPGGSGNTTEHKNPRIDLLDSGVRWSITMIFCVASTQFHH